MIGRERVDRAPDRLFRDDPDSFDGRFVPIDAAGDVAVVSAP